MKKNVTISFIILLILLISGCIFNNDSNEPEPVEITNRNLLFINCSERENSINGFTRAEVYFTFATPSAIGATSYTLQYYDVVDSLWKDVLYYGDPLETNNAETQDNFSLDPGADGRFRLRITGGVYHGLFSNEVIANRSTMPTYFNSWGLDESMYLSGTMAPQVGYGLQASFSLSALEDFGVISDKLTYQWYRLDPDDYEIMIAIDGAVSLEYTTTIADIGYHMMVRANEIPDEGEVGGFCQQKSSMVVR